VHGVCPHRLLLVVLCLLLCLLLGLLLLVLCLLLGSPCAPPSPLQLLLLPLCHAQRRELLRRHRGRAALVPALVVLRHTALGCTRALPVLWEQRLGLGLCRLLGAHARSGVPWAL